MSRLPKSGSSSTLTLESSLQSFFYNQLLEVNKRSSDPLPNETIYYSSLVMDKFGESENYFEEVEGKIREKILGLKLLESSHLSKQGQKRCLKDIGDTALLLCGFFSESLNRKLVDNRYYQEVGQIAYSRLNVLVPDAYNQPAFYELLSNAFDQLAMVISLVSQKTLKGNSSDKAFLILTKALKVS